MWVQILIVQTDKHFVLDKLSGQTCHPEAAWPMDALQLCIHRQYSHKETL